MSRFKPGDKVESIYNYAWTPPGTVCTVASITRQGSLRLKEVRGTYLPCKWKHHVSEKEKREMSSKMVHVAILVGDRDNKDDTYDTMVDNFNETTIIAHGVSVVPLKIMSAYTFDDLKRGLALDIHVNPDNRWLILTGNSIAERKPENIQIRNI